MKPEFDILGNLTPYDLVDFSYEDFQYYFVDIVIWRDDFGTDRNNIPKGMVQLKFK